MHQRLSRQRVAAPAVFGAGAMGRLLAARLVA